PGLTIGMNNGLLSGTPTTAGTYTSVAFTVTDAASTVATKSLSMTIASSGSPLVITTTSPLPDATVAVMYSDQLNASGGTPPYTWKLTSVGAPPPAGIGLDAGGLLSGVASSTGSATFP